MQRIFEEDKKVKILGVKIYEDIFNDISRVSKLSGMSVSGWVRHCIEKSLAEDVGYDVTNIDEVQV